MSMLHIHNGDCSADLLRQSGLPGEQLAWCEALIIGPTPQGLTDAVWLDIRADHLAAAYGVELRQCRDGLLKQEQTLHAYSEHAEIVLWFEHDLFCQTLLIYLLDWFSRHKLGKNRLSLICIDRFAGIDNFKGLGQLTPAQMGSLFSQRKEITGVEMNIAAKAWVAYCSPTPKLLEEFLGRDSSALPFLKDVLFCHLARFPSLENGLGRIEATALKCIHAGCDEFTPLFRAFQIAQPLYGFGDLQFWNDLQRMAQVKVPLLVMQSTNGNEQLPSGNFIHTRFTLTPHGEAVLAGTADFIQLNGINLWLGGVHLCDNKPLWRWDEQHQTLVQPVTDS